jgi:hypothetical protein
LAGLTRRTVLKALGVSAAALALPGVLDTAMAETNADSGGWMFGRVLSSSEQAIEVQTRAGRQRIIPIAGAELLHPLGAGTSPRDFGVGQEVAALGRSTPEGWLASKIATLFHTEAGRVVGSDQSSISLDTGLKIGVSDETGFQGLAGPGVVAGQSVAVMWWIEPTGGRLAAQVVGL